MDYTNKRKKTGKNAARKPTRLLRPDRCRNIERPFAWMPFRLLTDGFLARLTASAKLLYFFLCLVADRYGVSFYGDRRIAAILQLPPPALEPARHELIQNDLLAYDGRFYQVLSLPPPNPQPPDSTPHNRNAVSRPEPARQILKRLLHNQ